MDGAPQRRRSQKTRRSDEEEAVTEVAANPPLASATTAEPANTAGAAETETEPIRICPGCGRDVPQSIRECHYCQFVVSRYVDDAFDEPGPVLHPVPVPEPAPESPSLTPYIAAIVVLFLLGFVGLLYSRVNRNATDAAAAGPSGVMIAPPSRQPIAGSGSSAAPIAPTPDWHKVVKFKAQSAIGLTSFTIRGSQWRITWSTKPAAGRAGSFSATLTSSANPAPVPVGKTDQSKQETVSMTGPGDYTLDINSPQPCLIMVEDYY